MNDLKKLFNYLCDLGVANPLQIRVVNEFFPAPLPDEIRGLALLLLIQNAAGDTCLDLSNPQILREKLTNLWRRGALAIEDNRENIIPKFDFSGLESAIAALEDARQFPEIIERLDRESAISPRNSRDFTAPIATSRLLVYSRKTRKLYLQKLYAATQTVFRRAQNLLAMRGLSAAAPEKTGLLMPANFAPHAQQLLAVQRGASGESLLITGGPGTGKTTVAAHILNNLFAQNPQLAAAEIALTAFSGKAAARLSESLYWLERDFSATTIHRLLNWRGTEFFYGEKNPLPQKIFIIDESGMIPLELFAALLAAVPDGAQLLLLGDEQQLPSIEAGAVFADLLRAFPARAIKLTHSYRAAGKIFQIAAAIANGENFSSPSPFAETLPADREIAWAEIITRETCRFLPTENAAAEIKNLASTWAKFHHQQPAAQNFLTALKKIIAPHFADFASALPCRLEADAAFLQTWDAQINRAKILTLTRRGDYGCETLNAAALGRDDRVGKISPAASAPLADGCPILIRRNLPALRLFNGDIGVAIQTAGDAKKFLAVFRKERELEIFSFAAFAVQEWEPAIAMTVHKAQGSEFADILLALPDRDNHPLLAREIVYTGVTRAKKFCGVFGDLSALNAAINAPIARHAALQDFVE